MSINIDPEENYESLLKRRENLLRSASTIDASSELHFPTMSRTMSSHQDHNTHLLQRRYHGRYAFSPDILPITNSAVHIRTISNLHGHYFIGLDLDECSIVGSDTNDLTKLCLFAKDFHEGNETVLSKLSAPPIREAYLNQRLDHNTIERQIDIVAEATVNPELVRAYIDIQGSVQHKPYVFIYTNKGGAARAIAESYDKMLSLYGATMTHPDTPQEAKAYVHQWYVESDIHQRISVYSNGLTVFFEGSNENESYDCLWNQYLKDIQFWNEMNPELKPALFAPEISKLRIDFLKLGMNIIGIKKALKLDYNPPIFISSVKYKSLVNVMNLLGLDRTNPDDFQRLWLYDDRAQQHYDKMKLDHHPTFKQYVDPEVDDPLIAHLIEVQPYESTIMPPSYRAIISKALNTLIPVPKLYFMVFTQGLMRSISVPDAQ